MQATTETPALTTKPECLWRDLFVGRLTQLREQIPARFHGTLQFEVATGSDTEAWFVEILPRTVVSDDGIANDFSQWVVTDRKTLEDLVGPKAHSDGQLVTIGKQDILRPLLKWMAAAERPRRAGLWRGGKS